MPLALVTGASEGIGRHIAREFARRSHDLLLVARRADVLERVAAEIQAEFGVRCHVLAADLAVPDAAHEVHAAVAARRLTVDVLVNNAGLLFNGPVLDTERADLERLLRLNVVSLTALTHLFAADMVRRGGGRILNVASTAAWLALPGEAVYAASKAYVLSFSQALHNELAAKRCGVTVTVLCPGYTDTRMLDNPAQGPRLAIPRVLVMSPVDVARVGVAGCLRGRSTVIPGWGNRLLMALVQVLPRTWVTRIMGWVYRRSFAAAGWSRDARKGPHPTRPSDRHSGGETQAFEDSPTRSG